MALFCEDELNFAIIGAQSSLLHQHEWSDATAARQQLFGDGVCDVAPLANTAEKQRPHRAERFEFLQIMRSEGFDILWCVIHEQVAGTHAMNAHAAAKMLPEQLQLGVTLRADKEIAVCILGAY